MSTRSVLAKRTRQACPAARGCTMTDLSAIYRDADRMGVPIYSYDIGFADAATLEVGGRYAVMVDPRRICSISGIKGVLAHELGHCATGCTHHVSSPYDLVARHEYKANRWAVEQYLPFSQLNAAVAGGLTEPWQLAEYFDLPEGLIRWAIQYYTQVRQLTFG